MLFILTTLFAPQEKLFIVLSLLTLDNYDVRKEVFSFSKLVIPNMTFKTFYKTEGGIWKVSPNINLRKLVFQNNHSTYFKLR